MIHSFRGLKLECTGTSCNWYAFHFVFCAPGCDGAQFLDDLLIHYKNHPRTPKDKLFPNISNQKANAYLKDISKQLGITKRLTYHCARHTFATTVTLTNGVPMETVGQMLGHKNIRPTQHYARVTDTKVYVDMQQLKAKYSGESLHLTDFDMLDF